MTSIPDHYAALGIDPTADQDVITAAYRALAKKYHPDTGAAAGTASAARFEAIQQAYEVLRTPESRHAYDLELLAATEAELAAHLAAKRRVALRQQTAGNGAPPPDLGDIRPQPASPPPRAPTTAARKPRPLLPFAIPVVLVASLAAGAAWLFLPAGRETPPAPATAKQDSAAPAATQAAAPDAAAPPPAAPTPATPKVTTAEAPAKPASPAPAPAAPAAAAPAAADAPAGQPIFGSTATDAAPSATVEAAASPAEGAAEPGTDTAAAAAASPPPPVPKAKPATPVKQAPKPAAQPKPKKQPPPRQQQTAGLDVPPPPPYYPEPDGYPPPGYDGYDGYDAPPGYPPPGYMPPGYAPPVYVPPGYAPPPPGFRPPGSGPYRLVIFERRPGRPATAWSGGKLYNSMGKCTKSGVKTVLRRTSALEPYDTGVRIWYECQSLARR